jgi:hypothetical protein
VTRKKKKAEVVCIYPGFFYATTLPTDRAWTIFHRNVNVDLEHTHSDEHCWCNPICVPSDALEGGYTHDEWEAIVYAPKH